jgi:hypothetical protein
MALTVEDGTGLATADSYVSLVDALAYHAAMGNTAWAASTDAAREIALRRAAQYLDTEYRYRGTRYNATQALEWPRVEYEDGIRPEAWPVAAVEQAACEAALRALTNTLRSDVSMDQITEETVGPITIKYSSKSGQTRYPVVGSLLRRYVIGGGSSMLRVERAS